MKGGLLQLPATNGSDAQRTHAAEQPVPGTLVCTYIYEATNFYVDGVYDSSEDFVVGITCN